MAKRGGNKKACDRYKSEGHLQINKDKKRKKHEELVAKFAARKEAGKTYTYKPNPYKKDSDEYIAEQKKRAAKNVDHRDECSKIKSMMTVLQNQLNKEAKEFASKKKNVKRPNNEGGASNEG